MDVLQRFLKQVDTHPDAIAVDDGARQVTYKELNTLVLKIASALQGASSRPKVLVQIPQSVEAYASFFATLMVGGVYSPLNTEAPRARQELICEQFSPDVILTSSKLEDDVVLASEGRKTFVVEELSAPSKTVDSVMGELAYVIFTSGSTGIPKGVTIGRRALSHYIDWAIPALKLECGERCSQHPNIGFDLSVIDIYASLCSGATLCPITSALHRTFPGRAIKELKISVWVSVPSVIELIAKGKQLTTEYLSSLRCFFFCGEPLYKSHLDGIFGAVPEAVVVNTYGPTEATVSCTELYLTKANYSEHCQATVAIGEPISGMKYVLEGTDESEGELVLYGEQVAEGYWEDTQKTALAFISHPEYGRGYRTGDWVKRVGGDVYFSHRIDRQTKIGGYRVELGEIDEALKSLGAPAACTLVYNEELVSFIENTNLEDSEIVSQLQNLLPHYAVPRQIRRVARLPRNVNDKIDVRALEKELGNG